MIIEATEKDITLIQYLAERSWETTYLDLLGKEQLDYMIEMMYSEKELLSHFENPNYRYYIVKSNDFDYGFIGIELDYETKTTKLHRIYFLKEAQGKGFGKIALDFIKQVAEENHNNRIILTVNKHNKAQDFYKKLGFEIYDEAVFDIGGGYVMDDYLMELHF